MDNTDWVKIHQPFELNYHTTAGRRFHEDDHIFSHYWEEVMEWAQLPEVENGLDVGCGPRSVLGWSALCQHTYAIEPLSDAYKQFTRPEWWHNVTLYAQPAEKLVPELVDTMDIVWCWNVLDHTYDAFQILYNLAKYLKRTGVFVLATDIRPPSVGHPGFSKDAFYEMLLKHFTIQRERADFSERDICLILNKK